MINLDNVFMDFVSEVAEEEVSSNSMPIVLYESFLDRYLTAAYESGEIVYPYTINIPRDIDYMLKTGDHSPLHTFTIEEPILFKGKPIWTLSSVNGVKLSFGYENSDKSKLSPYKIDDLGPTSGPHGHIAGKSGGGKSVSLNAVVFAILFGYSPYEVNISLIDAKIAEAARYASGEPRVPHIKTIGATSDVDYIISILEDLTTKASKLNQLFASKGVSNIKDYREVTGLTFPRDLIFVDEYQLQYKNATDQEKTKLTAAYDKFCTAGRSSGTHLILCTQSFLAEVKSALFHNIELRATLTCVVETSEATLGNRVASNCKNRGEIFVNMAADQTTGESEKYTRMFKVPYQDKDKFDEHRKFLWECGKKINYDFTLNYYNETKQITSDFIKEKVEKYGRPNRLVLGEPSFVKTKETDVHYANLKFDEPENYLFYSPLTKDVLEFLETIYSNQESMDTSLVKIIDFQSDRALSRYSKPPDNISVLRNLMSEKQVFFLRICLGIVLRKIIILETDEEIFKGINSSVDAELILKFNNYLEKNNSSLKLDSVLQRQRICAYYNKLYDDSKYHMACNVDAKTSAYFETSIVIHAITCLEELMGYSPRFKDTQVEFSNIPITYVNLVGFDKIPILTKGSTDYKFVDLVKGIMGEANLAKTSFIAVATTLTGVSDFKPVFQKIITSNAKKDEVRLGIELPRTITPIVGYEFDVARRTINKFKRISVEMDLDE